MNSQRKIINWVFLIFWMCFIFYMSNQPANISDSQSFKAMAVLEGIGIDVNGIFGELANFVVRKCAHFLEYMILAFLTMNVVKMYFAFKVSSVLSVIFVFLYACTDEFHQLFIPGREGAFRDVMIDSCGALFGIAVIIILKKIVNKIKIIYNNKNTNKLN